LLTLIALLQNSLFSQVSVLGARPDILFAAVVGWALLRGSSEGIVWAFIGGMVLDLFSGGPMGGITLSLIVVALLAGQQWGRELGSATLQSFLNALPLCFLAHLLLLLSLGWGGYAIDWGYSLARIAAPSAILNAVLVPLIYRPLMWLDRRTRPEGLTFDV
jgi:rod shape-determining protein MreD